MNRSVNRASFLVDRMHTFDEVRRSARGGEVIDHVDPSDDEHVALELYLTLRLG